MKKNIDINLLYRKTFIKNIYCLSKMFDEVMDYEEYKNYYLNHNKNNYKYCKYLDKVRLSLEYILYLDNTTFNGENVEDLTNILLEKNINVYFTKNLFKCSSNEIIIQILKDLRNLNKNQTFSLIRVLEDERFKRLILDNNDVYNHLYSNINKDYRGSFTKKFKINEYDIA